MLLNDIFKIAGEDGTIPQCIAQVSAAGSRAKYGVLIPASYIGTESFSNPSNVPIIDLRASGISTGLGGTLIGPAGPIGPQGIPGTTNVPWADIQAYGATPRQFIFNNVSASANTTSGSPDVTIASGTFETECTDGQGVVIFQAGSPTSQSTPSAPTITSPTVSGSQLLTYKCVGYDAMGGLTAASASGTVSGPAVFGSLPVAISSISLTSNVVTVNFSAPLNTTVVSGMTVHITGVTGAGSGWNGVFTIASAPSTTQITYALTASDGVGTVTSAKGRVSNTAIITAISRDITGLITLTLSGAPSWLKQSAGSLNPTIVCVENCSPASLNGQYVISSISGNTVTCHSGTYSAVTGTLNLNGLTSTATVWEFTCVACPSLSGTTIGYYIYSDSPNPGGSLVLIGRTMAGESHFVDWGPCISQGYTAPSYIPTAPPASAQNQMFVSTVKSGGGTTSLVLNDNVTTTVSGATMLFDDGQNLLKAANACHSTSGIAGTVLVSAPTTAISFPGYVINSPIIFPEKVNIVLDCPLYVNETLTMGGFNQISGIFGAVNPGGDQFSKRNYSPVLGLASPLISLGSSSSINGLSFTNLSNGTIAVQLQGVFYTEIENCLFAPNSSSFGNAIGLVYNGSCSFSILKNFCVNYSNRFFGNGLVGQSGIGPPIPSIWIRCSDNPNIPDFGAMTGNFIIRGANTGSGRGMLFDAQYGVTAPEGFGYDLGDGWWLQQATTPTFMFWGQGFFNIKIRNVLNDTSAQAIVANWTTQILGNVELFNCENSPEGPTTTGNVIQGLVSSGNTSTNQTSVSSRMAGASLITTSAVSDTVTVQGATATSTVQITPTNAAAAADIASGKVYVSAKGANSVTISHSAIAGETFDISVTTQQ